MGEDSIAQEKRASRQGTADDGRKENGGKKERVDVHTGEKAVRPKVQEKSQQKKTEDPNGQGESGFRFC